MKKTLKSFIAIGFAIAAFISCNKEVQSPVEEIDGQLLKVTIIAGNPEAQPASGTKTMMVGATPYWCDGDKIGVSNGTSTNNTFAENSIPDGETAATATFSGSSVSGTLYAYYPFTSNGVSSNGAKVDIPANQNPTASSFDGAADIMLSKSFTVDPANTTVENLQFARLGAIVKIVLTDTESTMVGTQHPTTVSMTAASNLVGRVYIDMVNQELGELYSGQSATVTANYTAETKYAINGSNATYLIVYPQTLAAGSTLTIAASTEDYSIEKEITVPAGGIELLPGKVNTLNISLLASHITESTGAALPFNDNFSWQTGSASTEVTFETSPAIPSAKYSAYFKIYQGSASGVARMSTSSATGYLTTVELDLRSAFYVHINSKYWSVSDATKLYVSVDDGSPEEITLTDSYADYYVNFAAATKKSKVKITTTENKRAYIKAFDIISGTYVLPPVINVTSSNPMAVSNANDLYTIEYTISNPTAASISASANVAWIHDFDYSVDGEVTFEVDAQASGDPARNGVITLSYTGATDVEVTINQAAGAGGGLSQGSTKTYSISASTTNAQSFNKLIGNNTSSGNYNHASAKSITLDSHTWSITTAGNGSVIYCGGQQLGAGDKNGTKRDVTSVTMSTSAYTEGIKTIKVSSATNGSATLSVYVNDVQVESAKAVGSDVVYTLGSITAGTIRLEWTQSTAGKNLTIYSITIN